MTKKRSFRKRFKIFFLMSDLTKTNIHNAIKKHHLNNDTKFRKLKYISPKCTFYCNQLGL